MKRLIALATLAAVALASWLYLALRDSSHVWLRVLPDRIPKRDYYYETRFTR